MSPEMDKPMVTILRAPGLRDAPVRLGIPGAAPASPVPGVQQLGDAVARVDRPIVHKESAPPPTLKAPEVPQELIRAAEERGFEAGLSRGREAARIEVADKLSRLDQVLTSIVRRREDLLEVLEDDIVELAIQAASAVIGERVASVEFAIQAVRQALARPSNGPVLSIRLAPADLDLVAAARKAGGDAGVGIELIGDAAIELGGCIVDTPRGSLDLRIETLLEKLRAAILEARASKSGALIVDSAPAERPSV